MKKFAILLMIVFVCIFIVSCEFDNVHYCPYCGTANISKVSDDGTYKCNNSKCGKTFGAKEIE